MSRRRSLRIDPADVSRRGELERRKLRAMIDFCYTDRCYRAHILNYFGDRKSERLCGRVATANQQRSQSLRARRFSPRALTDDELLRVRKILACAKRMNGRFGRRCCDLDVARFVSEAVYDGAA
jgi:ATP-dependent DNA helicase RecQ